MRLLQIIFLFTTLFGIQCIRIENNGYKGITISFSEKVLQKNFYFNKFKDVLRNASEILFHATRRRSYFDEFIFVIPSTFTNEDVCDNTSAETPRNIDIYVTDSVNIPSLTARHSKGCGLKGDIIYLPTDWLSGDVQDLAHEFVQHWSTFRYGVFSENPERHGSCIATSDTSWSPTGCYNIELDAEASFGDDGLPLCFFPKDFKEKENLRSSIMFSSNSSKVRNFCDGSESLPHNPVAPTLHNRICEGKSVWSVIQNTDDFLYGRNMPVKDFKSPVFRCFKESKTRMTLTMQDTDYEARSEIRYALYYFLSNIAESEISVSLMTFSNETLTEAMDPVELVLQGGEKLKSLLLTYLKLNKKVEKICLICGLRKAYKVSAEKQHRVIVLFASASSLLNTDVSELTDLIQNNDAKAVLHMILLEDTENDVIPSSLVDTMLESNGKIFRIKNDRIFMFSQINIALLDASKDVLHIEDKILVVHQKTHLLVASNFLDVFAIPQKMKGRLLYTMQCKNRGDIRSANNDCSILDQELQSPICESKSDLNDDEGMPNVWKYSFEYMAGSEGSTCVSLALLKLASSSLNAVTIRGWLSENKITPGQNALIIYAEVINAGKEDTLVKALISGPGLTDFSLELRDNGNGDPDIVKGDNIYSRYFTSFTQKGLYTVSIHVKTLATDGNFTEGISEKFENIASQTKVIGSFRVTVAPPKEDIIPPNKVSDLNVVSIDNSNRTAFLQWTAPGDNYDYGKAKQYTIKLSNYWMSLLEIAFDTKENILLKTNEYLPASSGITETLKIQCPLTNYNTTYYLALRASDINNNVGKISNIIQIHFKEAYFPPDNIKEISTEISTKDGNQTYFPVVLTDVPTDISILPENKTKDDITTTQTIDGIFIEKKTAVIAASTFGAVILLIIIINIIICCCCFRRKKRSENPKKISRKASLRPPYNLNIAYRHGSQSSLEENAASHSMNTLVDPASAYSSSGERQAQDQNKYTYHTSHSLRNKMDIPNIKNDLGFKLVQPMPAYATSSLSRFAARQRDMYDEEEFETSNTRSHDAQHQTLNNAQETHIYPLGEV